jgi:hypothetical protein
MLSPQGRHQSRRDPQSETLLICPTETYSRFGERGSGCLPVT